MHVLIRIPGACQRLGGIGRSTYYTQAAAGLLPAVVKIAPRASAIPARELDAVIAARLAGVDDDGVRALVAKLHAERALAQ